MKGSYILTTELKKNLRIKVGKLGEVDFQKGYYCYVGSALGRIVNLENRIGRHKRLNKEKAGKLHWHIDYFLVNPSVRIVRVDEIKSEKRLECKISRMFEELAENSVHGFGCSDCNCKSHFYYFENKSLLKNKLEAIKNENFNTSSGE